MTRTRFALAAWAIVSATVSSQASANVINVVQADFGVISPLPYSRSFGDTFTGIAGTAGRLTRCALVGAAGWQSLVLGSAPPHMVLWSRLRLLVWHSVRSLRSPRCMLGNPGPSLTVGIVPARTFGILLESRLRVQRLRGRALGKRPDVRLRVWCAWVGPVPACGVPRHPMWTRGRRRGQGVGYPIGSTLGGCRA